MSASFKKTEFPHVPIEEAPHSLTGVFYHDHDNDKRFWRDPDGGWKKQGSWADPTKRKRCPALPRIRNGRIWPVSARKTHTIEDILEAQERRRQDNKAYSAKTKMKKKIIRF